MTLLLALLLACAVEDAAPTACEADTAGAYPTWSSFGEKFLATWCQSCHAAASPNRFGAPATVVFDTEADLVRQRAAVRRAVLEDLTMPLGGGVSDEERAELARYLDCVDARAEDAGR